MHTALAMVPTERPAIASTVPALTLPEELMFRTPAPPVVMVIGEESGFVPVMLSVPAFTVVVPR